MVLAPPATPVTMPPADTLATEGVPLLHTPPGTVLVSSDVWPTQTFADPLIGAGNGFTVTIRTALQPVTGSVYIIVSRPALIPVTTPVAETVPIAGVVVLHAPPGVAEVKAAVRPIHTWPGPPMKAGTGLTVTVAVLIQPVPREYVISAVPEAIPVTTPVEASTEAMLGDALVHVPPGMVFVKVVVLFTHTVNGPVMAAGKGFTVTTLAA